MSYKIGLARVEEHARFWAAKGLKDVLLREKLRDWLGINLE